MNVCLVIVSDAWGGAEAVVYELARHLRAKGHVVTVLANREIVKFYQELEDVRLVDLGHRYPFKSTALHKLRASSKYDVHRRLVSLVCTYLDELYFYTHRKRIQTNMTRVMVMNRIEVIHAHLFDDTFLVSGLHVTLAPRIATVHGLRERKRANILSIPLVRWKDRCYRKALIRMDVVTTVSVFTSEVLHAWEPRLKQDILVIPNGVDILEIRTRANLTPTLRGSFNLLFPGGAKPVKGGVLLIRALAAIKDKVRGIHAYLAGHVPENHPIRRMVREFQLESNTTFTGFLPRQQYRNLLKSVDLLVMPSREEANALVYLEAIALGKPIVAAKTSSVPETVQDGRNGILVRLDAHDIANAVVRLYRNRELAESIAKNNLQDAMKFDWSSIVDRYVNVYQQLAVQRNLSSRSSGTFRSTMLQM
jgi:glycosyltransferase involved in cell wall biosynthesis